jgi:hypothetical protein
MAAAAERESLILQTPINQERVDNFAAQCYKEEGICAVSSLFSLGFLDFNTAERLSRVIFRYGTSQDFLLDILQTLSNRTAFGTRFGIQSFAWPGEGDAALDGVMSRSLAVGYGTLFLLTRAGDQPGHAVVLLNTVNGPVLRDIITGEARRGPVDIRAYLAEQHAVKIFFVTTDNIYTIFEMNALERAMRENAEVEGMALVEKYAGMQVEGGRRRRKRHTRRRR